MAEPSRILDLDWKASLKRPLQWGLLAAVLTALVVIFIPNQYRSEARLLPVESKSMGGLGNLAAAAAAFGVAVPGGEGGDANFVDILNSRSLREELLKTPFEYPLRSWRFGTPQPVKGTLYDYLDEANMDRAVKKLGLMLSISRDLKSKVITLSAETKSPELSQQVVKRATKLLEAFLQDKGRTRGGAKAAYAEARLKEARQEMDETEATFRAFLSGNRNYLTSPDPTVRLRGLKFESELKLRQQLVTTLALNREQALLEEKNDIPILNVLDEGNLPIDKGKPTRSAWVFTMSLVVFVASLAWGHRGQIRALLEVD